MSNRYKIGFVVIFLLVLILQSSLVLGTKGWFSEGVNLTLVDILFIDTSSAFVGIGTLIPNQKLEVDGNVNVSGTVYASVFSSNSPLQLQTSGVTRIFVNDTDGNVGIGTSNPSQALDVVGNVNATGNISASDSVCLGNDCRNDWTGQGSEFGGIYAKCCPASGACVRANPVTGACTCPPGFSTSNSIPILGLCGGPPCGNSADWYFCYK